MRAPDLAQVNQNKEAKTGLEIELAIAKLPPLPHAATGELLPREVETWAPSKRIRTFSTR